MAAEHQAYKFIADEDATGERVDRYLAAQLPDVSRAQIQRAAEAGTLIVDGAPVKPSHRLKEGEEIGVTLVRPPDEAAPPAAESIDLDVVFEDDALIVINKPAGMVVHPAVGHRTGTLVNALLGHGLSLEDAADVGRPGIVHRLDKGTSGLIVCAKTESAHHQLADQLRDRSLSRTYLAVAWGHLKTEQVTFDGAIGRSSSDRKKMAVRDAGREARTHAKLRERFELAEFLELKLETGRTHQIRVHLAHAGHPIVGDSDYGGGAARLKGIDPRRRMLGRQMLACIDHPALHAFRMVFAHPKTGKPMEFEVPPPVDFKTLLALSRQPE